MLILTRRLGEKIYIGDDIILTICEMSPGKVRIGVEAPRSVPVHRDEIKKILDQKGISYRDLKPSSS